MPLVWSSMRPGATMAPPRSTVLSPLDESPSTILPVSFETTRFLFTSLPPSHTRQFVNTVVAMIGRQEKNVEGVGSGLRHRYRLRAAQLPTITSGACDHKADCYLSVAVLPRLKWPDGTPPVSSRRSDLLIAGQRGRSAKSRRRHRVWYEE